MSKVSKPKLLKIKVFRVTHALAILGLDKKDLFKHTCNKQKVRKQDQASRINAQRKPSFWQRDDLHYVLADAHKAYKASARVFHPDRGGTEEQMRTINAAWEFVVKVFAKKGFRLD